MQQIEVLPGQRLVGIVAQRPHWFRDKSTRVRSKQNDHRFICEFIGVAAETTRSLECSIKIERLSNNWHLKYMAPEMPINFLIFKNYKKINSFSPSKEYCSNIETTSTAEFFPFDGVVA
ncbi:hypothetical protein [Ralstonia solanacearum]|uniref:hypothetical protein n=1 Tax=Ralstonia solanacearum TaxID=305 RepID=UPI003D69F625